MNLKPDFFIIGAPKCGTTSLYSYLNDHNDVLSVDIKEPSFFSDDMPNAQAVKTMDHYQALYSHNDNKLCGDYSTSYFHSKVALERILKFNPKAKIIISLRQPVECVYSLFHQSRHSLNEPLSDFSAAWDASDARSKDEVFKSQRRTAIATLYKEAGLFGHYTQIIMKMVPKEQLHIILFDDLKSNPRDVYLSLLNFLDLKDDGRVDFTGKAAASKSRSKLLAKLLSSRGPIGAVKKEIKAVFGLEHTRLMKKIQGANTVKLDKVPMETALRQKITDHYTEDMKLLEGLLNRDLSHWFRL